MSEQATQQDSPTRVADNPVSRYATARLAALQSEHLRQLPSGRARDEFVRSDTDGRLMIVKSTLDYAIRQNKDDATVKAALSGRVADIQALQIVGALGKLMNTGPGDSDKNKDSMYLPLLDSFGRTVASKVFGHLAVLAGTTSEPGLAIEDRSVAATEMETTLLPIAQLGGYVVQITSMSQNGLYLGVVPSVSEATVPATPAIV